MSTNKKNILVLASWFPNDDQDPTGRFIIEQANAIKDIQNSDGNNLFNVHIVDCRIRYPLIPKSWQNWLKAKQIAEVMKIENFTPDIIWAHVAFPAGVIGLELKKVWPNANVILTEHCGPLSLLEKYFQSVESFNSHFLKYDSIVSVSSALAKEIRNRNSNLKVSVIGNFVHDDFYHASTSIPKSSNHCCFIGRCTYEKGFDLLIKILEEYDHTFSNKLVLHILGEGPLLNNLLSKTFKNIDIIYEGKGGRNSVISVLQKSAFLILPSRYETFSLVAAEAIVMGRKVLGFKCGGPEDFVYKPNGELISDYNINLLSEVINDSLKNRLIFNNNFNTEQFSKSIFLNNYFNIFLKTKN